jgi:hypothetical protein
MPKAIHCICRRGSDNLTPRGVVPIESTKGMYWCDCWTPDNPEELRGGWLYLHHKSSEPSYFGGIIEDIDSCITKGKRPVQGVKFKTRKDPRAIGQPWRGPKASQNRAFNVIEDATFDHEVA